MHFDGFGNLSFFMSARLWLLNRGVGRSATDCAHRARAPVVPTACRNRRWLHAGPLLRSSDIARLSLLIDIPLWMFSKARREAHECYMRAARSRRSETRSGSKDLPVTPPQRNDGLRRAREPWRSGWRIEDDMDRTLSTASVF